MIYGHERCFLSSQNCTSRIHFHFQWKGKATFWEQKLQNSLEDFLCLSFSGNFIGYSKQALKSDWLFLFQSSFLLAGEKVRYRADNSVIWE